MGKSQIKSKERVADHGEVFTNEREVNAMLDMVGGECERIDSRFLEPACGDGNFLAEVLRRKLAVVRKRYGNSPIDYERHAFVAVSSLYGVELLADNAAACRKRLFEQFSREYAKVTKNRINIAFLDAIRTVIDMNILCGNALSMRLVDENQEDTDEPMTRPLLEQGNDIFIRFNEAIPIFHKVAAKTDETLDSIISSRRPFGLSSKFRGHNSKDNGDFVLFQNGGQSYVSKNEIEDNGCADAWKVMIPFLGPGNDNFPHRVLGKPFISAPGEVCTETYLTIGPFGSEDECSNVISYLATRFLRFLVLLRKPSQNATRGVYGFVPMQDFSHPWADEQLYEKYGIGDDEQKFIESLVKEMNLDDRMVRADG